MIRHLLDSDTCIELIRARSRSILEHLRGCPVGSVAISTITLAELAYGVARSSDPARNAAALTQFCAPLVILPFDDRAATAYARVRFHLERQGLPIGPLDTLIAAHAVSLNVVLVTNNEREFRRIADLHVENWSRP